MNKNQSTKEFIESNIKTTKKIATAKTLKWTTFTVFPDLIGANYFIFGRYTIASIRMLLIILASVAISIATLIFIVWVIILVITVGSADLDTIFRYVLIPAFIGCGIIGVDLIWTIVDFILVATGNFKDANGVKINKSYPGYQTISRRERKLQKRNNRKQKNK